MKTFREYLEIIQEGKITSNYIKQHPKYKDKKSNSEGFVYIIAGEEKKRGRLTQIGEKLLGKNPPQSVTIYDITQSEVLRFLKKEGITAYEVRDRTISVTYPYVQLDLRGIVSNEYDEEKDPDDMGPEDYDS